MKKRHVELSEGDRKKLRDLLTKGTLGVRKQKRAQALLMLDNGMSYVDCQSHLGVTNVTLSKWANRYAVDGLELLDDRLRGGRPLKISGEERAKVTALACSLPPEGYSRWSLRLLSDRIVELGLVDEISHTEVGRILKKNELRPHLRKQWCISQLTSEFIARMELILRLYLLPYDPTRPVVCYDERPCFLIGDTVEGFEMKPGQIEKRNYGYSKHGACCLLASIEPRTGRRFVRVRRRRRKREFARFIFRLSELYPDADKILLVMDNLNTHHYGALYEEYDAKTAAWLMDRFEFIYTPKGASWLNMIEIEFSALSRQCLNRRIPSIGTLSSEVIAYFRDRNDKAVKINWQFSRENAREKLNRRYLEVNHKNSYFK